MNCLESSNHLLDVQAASYCWTSFRQYRQHLASRIERNFQNQRRNSTPEQEGNSERMEKFA